LSKFPFSPGHHAVHPESYHPVVDGGQPRAQGLAKKKARRPQKTAVHPLRTVLITVVQGLFIAIGLEIMHSPTGAPVCWSRLGFG
jgi:hypothetical protein